MSETTTKRPSGAAMAPNTAVAPHSGLDRVPVLDVRSPLHRYRRLLSQYLAPQRTAVLVMAALLLAASLLQLAGPQVVRAFVDAAQAGAAQPVLVRSALTFIALAAAYQAAKVLATYASERVAWTATNALRADLAAHVLCLDASFHKAHTPGELIERVDGDANALAGFFSALAVQLASGALTLAGVLAALYLVDVRLGLAFTAFVLLALLALAGVRRYAIPHLRRDRERSAAFYGYLGEALAAADDLRACGAVPYAMRRFFLHLRAWLPVSLRARGWGDAVWVTTIAFFALGDALAYGLASSLYRAHALSLGAVYMVVAYAAMLAAPIEAIRLQLQELQRAEVAIARVCGLLETRSRLADGALPIPGGALSLELSGVGFAYEDGEGEVLHDVSFTLAAGRTLAILGRTGCGKTTIARLLFRLYDPQVGTVRLGGVDLRQARTAALRARVGLVTQDVQLFAGTLRDNISFFDPAVSDARLQAVLESLGLGAWLARLPKGLGTTLAGAGLSAGEAQLVALARLFLKDPGLVVLDEPSSRLDPAGEALLQQALGRLLVGRTAVIIAHRLATVALADDVLILEAGRVRERGPRAALAADPGSRLAALMRADRRGLPPQALEASA